VTKEVPGIRPAVISTETGTRLDEYRQFRHVVRNVYTDRFDPAKLGKLVNSAPELFARTKAELLAFAAFYSPFHMSHVHMVVSTPKSLYLCNSTIH
jgi:hypothetical protein